jgi:O-6-methylguanine DNA methyltransferase
MPTPYQCTKLDVETASLAENTVLIKPASGRGETNMDYGCSASPFGKMWVAWTNDGIAHLEFEDEGADDLTQDWGMDNQDVEFHRDDAGAAVFAEELFKRENKKPLTLPVAGTHFQRQVWQALLAIPSGTVTTYSDIANAIGRPKSVRAVANAVGANPIAWLIPCHRVIRRDGSLGGYRWGLPRKQAMLAWEYSCMG